MGRLPRGWRTLALVVGGAVVLAAALVAVSVVGARTSGEEPAAPATLAGALDTVEMLDGIPQEGIALGSPDAPVTLVEYADLQCPYCAQWAREALPAIVDDYVRPGRVRLVFRGLAFIGQESETALAAALAAGAQARLWHVVDLLFRNQGAENGGWVTEDLLRDVGAAVPGLDAERMLAEGDSPAAVAERAAAERAAEAAGVRGTPSFELGPTGGALRPLVVTGLDAESFRAALDAALAE